jgi:hypothetical protein
MKPGGASWRDGSLPQCTTDYQKPFLDFHKMKPVPDFSHHGKRLAFGLLRGGVLIVGRFAPSLLISG